MPNIIISCFVSSLSILRRGRSFSLSCDIVLGIKFLIRFNLLKERPSDVTVTGRVQKIDVVICVFKYRAEVKVFLQILASWIDFR